MGRLIHRRRLVCLGALVVTTVVLVGALSLTGCSSSNSTDASSEHKDPVELSDYLMSNTEKTDDKTRVLPIDYTKVNEHPVTGYYNYTLDSGRTVKMYIPEHATLRAYITVLAVPDDTENVWDFLTEQGWIDQADTFGELLFVLEPKDGKWGSPADESDYLETCIGETVGNTAFDTRSKSNSILQSGSIPLDDGTSCSVFTGHSCNYYVGYKQGCAPLESWTSNNPLYVAAQAFIKGESAGADVLNASAKRTYDGINTGSYYPGFDDGEFKEVLTKMKEDGAVLNDQFITNAVIPAPTLFVGYANDNESVNYWKQVNDAVETDEPNVYRQSLDSDAWQTQYANSLARKWGSKYGISQVRVEDKESMTAADIRAFLSEYTRYTNCFAYSNALGVRADYYETTKAARDQVAAGDKLDSFTFTGYDGSEKTVEQRALQSTRLEELGGLAMSGTLYSSMFAFNDYDNDGTLDPRETLMYIPDNAKDAGENGAPVVVVWPGNTQSASTFFDCSMWWSIANDEGCAVVIMGEYCAKSAAGLTYGDEADNANFSRATLAVLENAVAKDAGITIDTGRVYGSGHSLGSRTVQTLTHNSEADYYAAVGSTSFPNTEFTSGKIMPSYLMIGEADISEPEQNRDLVKAPWDTSADSAPHTWVMDASKADGIDIQFAANNHESFVQSCLLSNETGRYYTYTWAKDDGTPLVQFSRTLAREHNCYPEEFREIWNFVSHYRVDDNGARYYSPSAFAKDDSVVIS